MSFRKEKKYRLTLFEFNNIKNHLIENGMCILHKPRNVISTYYDTSLLDMFYHSEEGVLPRKKIRMRSYNSGDISSIEVKISSIEGRYKKILKTTNGSPMKYLKNIYDHQYGLLTPSLLISYDREYFLFKGIRITFDTSIKYKNLRNSNMLEYNDPERVMEIKASINTPDDFIDTLIPNLTSRFSKYSRGLLLSMNQL
jgi:hypothetical protein